MEIVVHTYLSPRIIEVIPNTTSVTVQEIVNALRDWEDDNLSYEPLIDAAGKEALGGGITVGITATLQNARLMFTGRTSPLESDDCTADDPTGTVLHATGGHFQTNGVYPGCTVYNVTTGAMAAVTVVDSETELHSFVLSGGTRSTWLSGDVYCVYPNVQCAITGGNLVAVDALGNELSPVMQSPNVQVVRSSSSSATLQELETIQYAAYNNGVTLDALSPYSGTDFPVGTPQQPVNNLSDAVLIAVERGFKNLYFIGNFTFTAPVYLNGYILIGQGIGLSLFTFEAGALVPYCQVHEATVTGSGLGLVGFEDCHLTNFGDGSPVVSSVDVIATRCLFSGQLLMPSNYTGEISAFDCWAKGIGTSIPVLDMNHGAFTINIKNWAGGCEIKNCAHAENKIGMTFISGRLVLGPTNTAGILTVRGVGTLENTSTLSIDSSAFINAPLISQAVWDELVTSHTDSGTAGEVILGTSFQGCVYVDSIDGESGTDYPMGTQGHPVNNIDEAKIIADAVGIRAFKIRGPIQLNETFEGYSFTGTGDILTDAVDINGQNVSGSYFNRMYFTGAMSGSVTWYQCLIGNVTGLAGVADSCGLDSPLTLGDIGTGFFGISLATLAVPTIVDMVGQGRMLQIEGGGNYKVINAGDFSVASLSLTVGEIELDVSCTGGLSVLDGSCMVTNNSTMTVVDMTLGGLHGEGSWEGAGGGGWSDDERSQIRDALGITGTKLAAVGGQLQTIKTNVDLVKQVETGRWKIQDNQMIFYDTGGNVILTFDLKDKFGLPTEESIYERVPA